MTTVTPATGMPLQLPAAVNQPRRLVIGLDLSLTSTGVAGEGWSDKIRTKLRGDARLRALKQGVVSFIRNADLVVMEGPSFGHTGPRFHEDMAGLRGIVRLYCFEHHIPYGVMPPSCLKVYATGNGKASKDGVRAAIASRYGHETDGLSKDDEADAYVAMAAGYHWLGQPLHSVPESHRRGLDGCKWPEFLAGGAL